MASSMITGDRRWASSRRGGMTVLGKVAVPKPINLPSQRLENHGLDPNVEIVPKGTLSWGSRPSSAGSNPWGSSALSPSTDGSSSSPSHLVGRPSSGGGTRPSTAGSEKAHDSNVSAWGSNSRPSSASGVLASNHASFTSSRPRSAETRPGSSQLSRFAEPLPENSGAWGPTATSERMGVANSAKDGFSLSSGDFPTLGSEKDESRKNTESLDCASHARPGSSSGRVTTMADSMGTAHGDDFTRNTDFKGHSWRQDGPPNMEDGPRLSMERWHGEPHVYQNPNMAPHYESWRGAPPVNPPGGVWYRGPPGPPYGGPVTPGGFPMEAFPYYRPQVPAPGLGNSQPIPPPGPGPHGHHAKNGDMFRPHIPESYLRPGMPIRPGFYPGPVPYEGYYGPPMGFCNPSERDLQFMGMAGGPPVYNRHVNQNASDPNNCHPRSGEGRAPDQVEPGHPHDHRGNHKVLMKQNDGWNHNDEEKWGQRVNNMAPNREKGILSKASVPENAWGDDCKQDEDVHHGKNAPNDEVSSKSFEDKYGPKPANVKLPGGVSNVSKADLGHAIENSASPKDHSLIQKIEGLNAKARASGGRQDALSRDEHDGMQNFNAKANRFASEANSDVVLERHYPSGVPIPVARDFDIVTVDKSQEPTIASVSAVPRKTGRGVQSRGDHHGKGRFNGQESDGWRKRPESHTVVSASGSGSTTNDQGEENHAVVLPAVVSKPSVERKGDDESVAPTFDPNSDTQRAKMREIAKQRAIQLQKEEEERIREQKAKALAKLEELNRRSATQGMENPSQKLENAVPQKQEDAKIQPEPSLDANQTAGSLSTSNIIVQTCERIPSNTLDFAVSSIQFGAIETKKSATSKDSVSLQNQLPTADVTPDEAARQITTAPQVREVSKQKRVGYKQRQHAPPEKNLAQDSIPSGRKDVLKDQKDNSAAQEGTGSGTEVASGAGRELGESPLMSDPPAHQRKKNTNKSGKNKHKPVEESSTAVSSSVAAPKESSNLAQAVPKSGEQNASDLNPNSNSIQSSIDAKDAVQSSENHSLSSREDAHGRPNTSWKSQHSRKPRSSQGNRSSEKSHGIDAVVWAPVRSHNKVEVTEQASQKAAEPSIPSPAGDNVHNSSKTKRAEMERYVPKPVAKELAQQGSIQQSPSPSVEQTGIDGTTNGKLKASQGSDYVAKAGTTTKQSRAQASWRQRGSDESQDVSTVAANNTSKNTQTSNGSQQIVKSDEPSVKGLPSRPDDPLVKGSQAIISDGCNSENESSATSSAAFTGVREQAPSGRGKRHPFKGNRGSGSSNQNFDHKDSNAGLTDLQGPPVETSQTMSPKESRPGGDRSTSHWQPKYQGYVGHNQQGNRSRGDHGKAFKRENVHNGDSHHPSQHNQGVASEDKDAGGGTSSLRHQETKGEKKDAPSVRGRPHTPNQEPASEVEPGRNEQRPSSGYRKNNYGGRVNRGGYESRGDWSSAAQESKQHYSSANRERQRQNPHYEYQPVGPNSRSNDFGAQIENNQPGGPRFRERGQSHSRRGRGNFYGRQSGNPTDASYE